MSLLLLHLAIWSAAVIKEMHSYFEEMMLSASRSELNCTNCKEYNVEVITLIGLGMGGGETAAFSRRDGGCTVQHVSKA
jgi:hypothetical protein